MADQSIELYWKNIKLKQLRIYIQRLLQIPRWEWQSLSISFLVLFGVAVRILFLSRKIRLERDEFHYIDIVRKFLSFGGVHELYQQPIKLPPPMATFLSVLPTYWGASPETAPIITNMVLGILLIVFAYFISYILTENLTFAFCCSLLLAVHPNLVRFSTGALRDGYYLFFLTLAVFSILWNDKKNTVWAQVLAGGSMGVAIWVRYEAIELPMLAISYMLMKAIFEKSWRRELYSMGVILSALIFSVVSLPCFLSVPLSYYPQYFTYLKNILAMGS